MPFVKNVKLVTVTATAKRDVLILTESRFPKYIEGTVELVFEKGKPADMPADIFDIYNETYPGRFVKKGSKATAPQTQTQTQTQTGSEAIASISPEEYAVKIREKFETKDNLVKALTPKKRPELLKIAEHLGLTDFPGNVSNKALVGAISEKTFGEE